MDPTMLDHDSTSEPFFDALDAFPPPESDEILVSTTVSHSESIGNVPEEEFSATRSPENPSPAALRRRRSSSKSTTPRRISAADSKDPRIATPREMRNKILLALKDEEVSEKADAPSSSLTSDQMITRRDQDRESSIGPALDDGSPTQSLLVFVAGLVIKAIVFQIYLLISCFTFPIWLVYCSFLFFINPFGTLKRARDGVRDKLLWVWKVLLERISPLLFERLRSQQGVGKFVVGLVWGCVWSFYVCFVLFGLLATAFIAGSLLMRRVVEEPVQMIEDLSFDYTKASPVSLVPISSCDAVTCGLNCGEKAGVGKHTNMHFVPPNHNLQLTISLTLPESDYNRRLGVFQVRAEFLSANGKVTASSSHPCMLQFKSSHIRFLETILKSGPLLTGYSSESQVLSLKMTGITEGTVPTACIRVILEQRAEYRIGAGIPEIYDASLRLESELPFFKMIIWNWRRTLFIWISIGFFISEFFIILVCCRPLIIPRARSRIVSSSRV